MKRRDIPEVRRCCNGSRSMRAGGPLFTLEMIYEKKYHT
jgi:hypothetical protein